MNVTKLTNTILPFLKLFRDSFCVTYLLMRNVEFEQYPDMGGPEKSILGSEYFSYNEMETNHELLKNNQDYLSQIITHKYNIEDVQKAYEHFFSPDSNAGKIAVEHN